MLRLSRSAAGRRSPQPQDIQIIRLESEMAVSRQNTTEFTEGDDDEGEGEHSVCTCTLLDRRHALQFAI